MQVVLLEQIKKLGKVGDIVNVRSGYGRNYLIPNNKALRATKDNLAYFDAKKADIEKDNAAKRTEAEKLAKKLEGAVVTLISKAGEDGRLYGSIKALDIARALNEQSGQDVDRKQVVLHDPIKYIGVHTVELHLYGDVTVDVHPNVSRSEDEAKESAARFAKGETVMEGRGERAAASQAEAEEGAFTEVDKPVEEETAPEEASEEEKAAATEKAAKKKAKAEKKSKKSAEEAAAEEEAEAG